MLQPQFAASLSYLRSQHIAWEQQGNKPKGNQHLTAPMADGTTNLDWKLPSASQNTSAYRTVCIQAKLGRETPSRLKESIMSPMRYMWSVGSSSWLPSAKEIWTCWSKSKRWLRASDKQTAQSGKEKAYQHV